MEERSLKVVDSNKTFFGKLSKTLSKIIIPTKIGINGMVITMKRNAMLKTYEAFSKENEDYEVLNNPKNSDVDKQKILSKKYKEAYSIYLEAIDKYIMDTVYKKVKTNTASAFEKDAMGNYYKITTLKEKEYTEYKYQKQKYLIELDYESLKLNAKGKALEKYKDFYVTQMDSFYKGILKNYSVKLAECSRRLDTSTDVYNKIFDILDEYINKILIIKLEDPNNGIEERVGSELNRLDQFDIGELDSKDYVEKNMLLLGISRQIFTHSLPLVAAEQCYDKLLKDIISIASSMHRAKVDEEKQVAEQNLEKAKLEAYNLLLDLLENYNIKLLSGKVYWEKTEERESYKKFYEEYEKAETAREKEILFLRREITTLEENDENKNIIKFYKDRLVSYGVMRKIKDDCKTSTKYIRNK